MLVVGDVMLDRYWYGSTTRISPEAPVPAVHVQDVEERPGGAGNVAANLVALGAHATLMGCIGEDEAGETLKDLLSAQGVHCHLVQRPGQATVTKLRVVSRRQQLIRLDFEDGGDGVAVAAEDPAWEAALAKADVVVLSDYGKGALAGISELVGQARLAGKPVAWSGDCRSGRPSERNRSLSGARLWRSSGWRATCRSTRAPQSWPASRAW